MTNADFGICPFHGPVAAQPDFSLGLLVAFVLLMFVGVGLVLLPAYVFYIFWFKDRVCPHCHSRVYPAPVPVYAQVYHAPVVAPVYYPYPPERPYDPRERR